MNGLRTRFLALSEREQKLLLIAGLCVIGGLYLIQRYLPYMNEIEGLRRANSQLSVSVRATRIPRVVGADTSSLEAANQTATASLEEITRSLRPLEERFAKIDSPAEMQGLMVMLSQLASETGVIIRESASDLPPEVRVPDSLANELAGGGLYKRPARKIVLNGTYPSLRRFLIGLGGLEKRVVVLQFSLENSGSEARETTAPWLSSTVRLTL